MAKITKSQLRQLIRESIEEVLLEESPENLFLNEGIFGTLKNMVSKIGGDTGEKVKAAGTAIGSAAKTAGSAITNKITASMDAFKKSAAANANKITSYVMQSFEEAKKKDAQETLQRMKTEIQKKLGEVYLQAEKAGGRKLSKAEVGRLFTAAVAEVTSS